MNYDRNLTFKQGLAQTSLSINDSYCQVAPTLKEMELISYLHIIQYLAGESKKCIAVTSSYIIIAGRTGWCQIVLQKAEQP